MWVYCREKGMRAVTHLNVKSCASRSSLSDFVSFFTEYQQSNRPQSVYTSEFGSKHGHLASLARDDS